MGQGYSMTTLSAASASIDTPELGDLVHEKTLSSARFMKSIRARNPNGFVFVKAVMKPYSSFQVQKYIHQITDERNALSDVPNALAYQRIIEVGSGGFLVRQYVFSSVYDRMSTRPFLEDIEKKWMIFQLLCAVRDCHARNIYHGDIKTENVLVTSWNWLYLTDFSSSFKPTHLPEDNPADFSFYFDTSGRRTCYLAPERFAGGSGNEFDNGINWAMDIFSVGCVIAEIFLEGPIFSLSQIFKYRSGEYSPEHTHLNKIEDLEVREMILNMIDLDPEKRYSAEQHLTFYRTRIFPEYFYSFLHQYMLDLTASSSEGGPVSLEMGSQGESDDRIDRLYYDFEKISYFLGYSKATGTKDRMKDETPKTRRDISRGHAESTGNEINLQDGTVLFMDIVVSSMRNTAKASPRLKACELLVSFAEHLSDEAKLDRILPFFIGLLDDPSDVVKVAALNSMTSVLDMVQVVSPINAYIFPEYIFPKLKEFIPGEKIRPSPLVRATYASCLATLAEASARVLDMVQAIRADGRLPALTENEWGPEMSFHGLYDVARLELVPHFEEATKALITDDEVTVRRAFLGSVSRLCVFFGSSKASDIILSYLNTYLNDQDWILKCTFYEALVGVAAYVGSASLEKFILPVMIQSLTDTENFVVEKVFRSLARMADLGLLSRPTTWNLISIATRFLIHPSLWIREGAAQFIAAAARYVSLADRYCIILPMIQPFLKSPIADVFETSILDSLKRPLSRSLVETAISWASNYKTSTFWTAASRDAVFFLPEPGLPANSILSHRRTLTRVPPSQRNNDDQSQLETLRRLGMSPDDEMKLLALREYIFRIAHPRFEEAAKRNQKLGGVIALHDINVNPQTVFFNEDKAPLQAKGTGLRGPIPLNDEPHTLTDALLDASTTIEDEAPRRSSNLQVGSRDRATSQQPNNLVDLRVPSSLSKPSKLRELEVASSPGTDVQHNGNNWVRREGSAASESSPSDIDKASFRRQSTLAMRHQNSAINLLKRNDTSKATAATSTTSENAFGKLDGPFNALLPTEPSALSRAPREPEKPPAHVRGPLSQPTYAAYHDYEGSDPNVLRLLDNHYVENYATDLHDFAGSTIFPMGDTFPVRRATDTATLLQNSVSEVTNYPVEPWRPAGHLLVMYSEHTAAINRVALAPDHVFFVTASDDGTCKVWDSTRLEKNVATRSQLTYRHSQGVKMKALCFVENTHTFVSAADDGTIHVVNVERPKEARGDILRYSKPTAVRQYRLPTLKSGASIERDGMPEVQDQEYAIWLSHHRTSTSQSVLLAATNRSRVIAIDLKSPSLSVLYTLAVPLHHGTPTTFYVDSSNHWLLLGTSHGVLDLWDLRFRVCLRSFGLPTNARVDRITLHSTKGNKKWVFVSSGGEVSVWDLENIVCKEVYRPSGGAVSSTITQPYEAWYPDDDSTDNVLARFAKDSKAGDTQLGSKGLVPTSLPVKAFNLINDLTLDPDQVSKPRMAPLLITGGADRTLRYWDITRPERSTIISGPALNTEDGTEINRKIKYETSYPLSASPGAQVMVVTEIMPESAAGPMSGGSGSERSTPSKRSAARGGGSATPSSATSGSEKEKSKPPRNTVISTAQQRLLRTHVDGITDVVVLRKPYGLVVSVDHAGGIFVFQ